MAPPLLREHPGRELSCFLPLTLLDIFNAQAGGGSKRSAKRARLDEVKRFEGQPVGLITTANKLFHFIFFVVAVGYFSLLHIVQKYL